MKPQYIIFVILIVIICIGGIFYFQKVQDRALDAVYSNTTQTDLIRVTSPRSGEIISTSTIVITGSARGNWYFEASFPIVIVDWDGLIIGQGHAEAQGDWMTEDFVPFRATVSFTPPAILASSDESFAHKGTIILKNDNPSGDPSRDKSVEVPIIFDF